MLVQLNKFSHCLFLGVLITLSIQVDRVGLRMLLFYALLPGVVGLAAELLFRFGLALEHVVLVKAFIVFLDHGNAVRVRLGRVVNHHWATDTGRQVFGRPEVVPVLFLQPLVASELAEH